MQERGESFYNPKLPGIVEALAEVGILEDSDGAKVVWTEPDQEGIPPLMVQKSDGGFGYARCGIPVCAPLHPPCDGAPSQFFSAGVSAIYSHHPWCNKGLSVRPENLQCSSATYWDSIHRDCLCIRCSISISTCWTGSARRRIVLFLNAEVFWAPVAAPTWRQ